MGHSTTEHYTLIDGREVTFPRSKSENIDDPIVEITVFASPIGDEGSCQSSYNIGGQRGLLLCTVHASRSLLEKHGIWGGRSTTATAPPKPRTPEDMLIELLESLGVNFNDQ